MSRIRVNSSLGSFSFILHEQVAPRICSYFKQFIRNGEMKNVTVFRIVSEKNHDLYDLPPIRVIQMGPHGCVRWQGTHVPHEGTDQTGLTHRKWTVSAARIHLNEVFGSFFICMRDEPELDHGGSRQPDGQGFAAFGQVDQGFDTLERIYAHSERNDWLKNEIPIRSVELLSDFES